MNRFLFIVCTSFVLSNSTIAQSTFTQIKSYCDSSFQQGYNEGQFPGLTAALVQGDSTAYLNSGVLEINSSHLVDSTSLFQLGSIGKVITAIAVLQVVESGKVSLNEDINSHLPFRVVNPYNDRPITLVDLLTHSAGLNDRNIGYMAKDTATVEPLESHLRNHLPSFFQESGLEINYSNYSYALCGLIVEYVTGTSFTAYVEENIFNKIGMFDSFVGVSEEGNLKYAVGYQLKEDQYVETQNLPRHAVPAGSFVSNAWDMGKLLRAFSNLSDRLLTESSWQLLTTRTFTNDAIQPGYSLGLEEQNINGHLFWAKGGMLKGFLSHMVILPDNTTLFVAINTSQDEFLEVFYENLMNRFFPDVSQGSPAVEADVEAYLGEYASGRQDRDGVESLITLFSGANRLWESTSGNLLIWHNGTMNEYAHIGDDVFEHTNKPYLKMVFSRDSKGRVNRMYRGVNIGGMSIPSTFEKTKWYNSPTFVNEYYAFILVGIVIYALPVLFFLLVQLIRRFKPTFWKFSMLPWYYYLAGLGTILLLLIHSFGAIIKLVKNVSDFLTGYPDGYLLVNSTAYLFFVMAIICLYLFIASISKSRGSIWSKFAFGLLTFCSLFHIWYLWYWNFI